MPKVTITFNLPEESSEHMSAIHGGEWRSILCELDNWLRNALKYGHTHKSANAALQAARDQLWNECREHNLDPWDA